MRLPNPTPATWAALGIGAVAIGIGVAATRKRKPRQKPQPVEPQGVSCAGWGPVQYEGKMAGIWVDDPETGGCRPQCLGPYKLTADGKGCEPMFETPPAKVGDVMAQGTEGPVQWRVIWASEPGNPASPYPYGDNLNVYHGEFLDTEAPIFNTGKHEPFGPGYFDLDRAIAETIKRAQERHWAP